MNPNFAPFFVAWLAARSTTDARIAKIDREAFYVRLLDVTSRMKDEASQTHLGKTVFNLVWRALQPDGAHENAVLLELALIAKTVHTGIIESDCRFAHDDFITHADYVIGELRREVRNEKARARYAAKKALAAALKP